MNVLVIFAYRNNREFNFFHLGIIFLSNVRLQFTQCLSIFNNYLSEKFLNHFLFHEKKIQVKFVRQFLVIWDFKTVISTVNIANYVVKFIGPIICTVI